MSGVSIVSCVDGGEDEQLLSSGDFVTISYNVYDPEVAVLYDLRRPEPMVDVRVEDMWKEVFAEWRMTDNMSRAR